MAENTLTGQECGYYRPAAVSIVPDWVTTKYRGSEEAIHCSCACDRQPTGSSTSPLTGNQNWTLPITGWSYKGASFRFGITYNSHSLIDPQSYNPENTADPFAPLTPNLMGLSERNSKFSQPFAQWIDLYTDEAGTEYAVWHHGDGHLAFKKEADGTFSAPHTGLTLTSGGSETTTYPCNGQTPEPSVTVPYSWFTIQTADGTRFLFNQPQMGTGTHLYWVKGHCNAIPHYLLSRIQDRWNRAVNLTWSDVTVGSGTEKRVTAVRDPNNTGLTLSYTNGLLTSVQDPQGRTHTLVYSAVADETLPTPINRQKLTTVYVRGPGSPNRVVYTWNFTYRIDAATDSLAYGGTVSGDLVIRKQDPEQTIAGRYTDYRYELVGTAKWNDATAPDHRRRYVDDWDGRVTRIAWLDDSEGTPAVERVITRVKDSATQATLTYPGGVAKRYTYTDDDLTSVTDVSTGRTWSYSYDTKHNPLTVRSLLEASGNPLVQYDYLFDSLGRIDQVTAKYRQDDGSLGDPVETQLNDLNLPTQVKAYARSGSVNKDEITQFEYDNGAPIDPATSKGNLTKITQWEDVALNKKWDTLLFYDSPDGDWGLPTRVQNDVTAESSLDYDDTTGLLLSSASPENLLVAVGHVDRAPSTTVLQYNSDQLPSLVQDPMGHQVAIGTNALAPNSAKLVVTTTNADSSTRTVTLDPKGRALEAVDENGIKTVWTYNPQGQVKTVTRDAANPDPSQRRVTTLSYDDRGDLRWLDPPGGSSGRVSFEYNRYTSAGVLVTPTVYEGQVTHSAYADGRHEYFGYNDAGELSWKRKSSGHVITIATRDAQHRVTRIDYPAAGGGGSFSVSTAYDEFGRVASTTDNSGTTTQRFDALDRPLQMVPPAPQKTLDYTYQPDTTLKRWSTTVNVSGIGTYQYRGDTKGRFYNLTNSFSQTFRQEYDRDGNPILTVWPSGAQEERTYTGRDWLASILLRQQNGSVLDTLQYFYTDAGNVYDPTGHLRREVDSGSRTHAFSYNHFYELTQETHPDPAIGTTTYSLDANGNRTSVTRPSGTDYYGIGSGNRLLWVNRGTNAAPTAGQTNSYTLFSYNTNGLVSQRDRRYDGGLRQVYDFLWDADDRLRQVQESGTTRFSALYDGDGTRVHKEDTRGGVLTANDYSYGPGGLLWSSNPNTVYTPGFGHRSNGVSTFYHTDWLGSTRYTSDSTGNTFPQALRYDAYGNRSATFDPANWQPTDLQYAGGWGYQTEWASATEPGLALQCLDQRYYDPAIGRFISPDPIGFVGGLNLYAYCGNNPVGGVDPTGLKPLWYDYGLAYHASRVAEAKTYVNEHLATNAVGVLGATVLNSFMDIGVGALGTLSQIGHYGEGAGCFAGDPSLENLPGLLNDVNFTLEIGLAVAAPGARAGGATTRALETGKGALAGEMAETPYRPGQYSVSASKIDRLAELMRSGEFNWAEMDEPILVDENGVITSGHHRIVAAQRAGVQIPEGVIGRGTTFRGRPIEWGQVWVLK